MTYRQEFRKDHVHRYNIFETNSGQYLCVCLKPKPANFDRSSVELQPHNKYRNIPTEYNGVCYHSKFERDYAEHLDWQKVAGKITRWERQVKLDLKVNGIHITNYYIDFIAHYPDESREFIETKGLQLADWRIKWKLLEATFESFKNHPDDRMLLVRQSKFNNYNFNKNGNRKTK